MLVLRALIAKSAKKATANFDFESLVCQIGKKGRAYLDTFKRAFIPRNVNKDVHTSAY